MIKNPLSFTGQRFFIPQQASEDHWTKKPTIANGWESSPRSNAVDAPERLGRIDTTHGESHAALAVDLEHFHAHDVAFLQLVTHPLDALV